MENGTKRKLIIAAGVEILVSVVAGMWLLTEVRAALVSWGTEVWDWQYQLSDWDFLFAWAQYMVICTAFLLAWLCWNWPRHKISIMLLVWGITWIPVALVSSCDLLASPAGPMNLPLSMYAVPLFGGICLFEALVLGVCIRIQQTK